MAGFGLLPAGLTPAGSGSFVSQSANVVSNASARKIDPSTRDYVLGESMPQGIQAAFLAVATTLKSAIDPKLGRSFGDLSRIAPDLERRVSNAIGNALAPAVSRGLIQTKGVSVTRTGATGVNVVVSVFDVLEKAEYSLEVPL